MKHKGREVKTREWYYQQSLKEKRKLLGLSGINKTFPVPLWFIIVLSLAQIPNFILGVKYLISDLTWLYSLIF